MLTGMKAMGAVLAVGALASAAWAVIVTPPTVEITAPASAKVGTTFSIQVHATSGTNENDESNGPIVVTVTVTQPTRSGATGGKRKITKTVDNHKFVDIDVSALALGGTTGASVTAESTVFTPEGPVTTTANAFVPFTHGNQ